MPNNVTFEIKATMDERWVDHFCSMLKHMEYNGNVGHTERIGIMSDGDGDFRPTFDIGIGFEGRGPKSVSCGRTTISIYDAG